jgi:ribosome-associated protein
VYLIAQAACDKKAQDIVVLDMRRPSQFCDYFVIASGNTARQVRAISDNIEEKARRNGIKTLHIEGYEEGSWVLMDYQDIVVHIFISQIREFYDLERLWRDAPKSVFDSGEGNIDIPCRT